MSDPSYTEGASPSTRTRDYARRVREDGCPDCGHDTLVVTEAYSATRMEPACWLGRCTCADNDDCAACWEEDEPDRPDCECECHCNCQFET